MLSEASCSVALALPRKERRRFAAICRALASNPHRGVDYLTTDRAGRALHNLLIDDWVITYWADHPVKEMRIVDVAQV